MTAGERIRIADVQLGNTALHVQTLIEQGSMAVFGSQNDDCEWQPGHWDAENPDTTRWRLTDSVTNATHDAGSASKTLQVIRRSTAKTNGGNINRWARSLT